MEGRPGGGRGGRWAVEGGRGVVGGWRGGGEGWWWSGGALLCLRACGRGHPLAAPLTVYFVGEGTIGAYHSMQLCVCVFVREKERERERIEIEREGGREGERERERERERVTTLAYAAGSIVCVRTRLCATVRMRPRENVAFCKLFISKPRSPCHPGQVLIGFCKVGGLGFGAGMTCWARLTRHHIAAAASAPPTRPSTGRAAARGHAERRLG